VGIVDEDIGRVRDATDIVAVISQYTQLKRVGQRWSGLCPFHAEKSPSFSVNPTEGLYHCFGCKASGDAITFVREKEQLDFVGAIEFLASRAGLTLRYTDRDEGVGRLRQAKWFDLTERAADWYHQRLRSSPDAAAARGYLRGRGFDADEVAHFRLGWAPDGWDLLARHLGAPVEDLQATGLGFKNRAGRLQDFFRARILFPIFDERGRVVGFGGRKLPDTDGPKYQNSRDSELYNKSRVLYGLNWAKADAVNHGEIVICEGYTDVIGFARAGIPRAVATCGTALTEDHVRHLKRFTRRLVLAYDADEAGQAAADRVYAWEQAHDVEVAVVALPAGSDPDELARTSPETLHAAVGSARPFLDFRVDRVLGAADLRSPESRARAADAALEVVAEHPNDLVRDQYVMQVADACRIDAGRLRERLTTIRRAPRRADPDEGRSRKRPQQPDRGGHGGGDDAPPYEGPPPGEDHAGGHGDAGHPADGAPTGQRPVRPVRDGVETETLRLALQQPELVAPLLDECLFDHPVVREAYRVAVASPNLTAAIEQSPGVVAELLTRLSVEESGAEPTDVLTRLATEVGRRVLLDLEAEARSSEDPLAYSQAIHWLKVTLDEVRAPTVEVETLTQLIAWLAERRRANERG
jgi:DNA primase